MSNLRLEIRNGALTGTGTSDYRIDGDCDAYSFYCEPVLAGSAMVTVSPAGSTVFTIRADILPWEQPDIRSAWPISPHHVVMGILPPSDDWFRGASGTGSAQGMVAFRPTYFGDWDDIRGQVIEFQVEPWLTDLSGTPVDPQPLHFAVHDIGPAVRNQEMTPDAEVATSGDVTFRIDDQCSRHSNAVLRTETCTVT